MGNWAVLRYALNPGMLSAVVLATILSGLAPPAWGSEVAGEMLAAEAEWQMLLVPSKPGSEKLGPEKLGPEPSGVSVLLAQDQPSPPALGGVARPEAGGGEVEMPEVEMPGGEMSGGEAIAPRAIDASDAVVAASGDIAVDGGLTDGGPIVPLAETLTQAPPQSSGVAPAERSEVFGQAAYLQQGGEGSARLRLGGIYVLSPSVFAGATVDLSTGQAFSDSDQTGLSLSELYLTASPANLPELRFTVGLMDLTSYLDRNSFAKDSLTHFFNPVFQTNPALSTVNVASRPGALVNWMPVDAVSLTATTFSANRSLGSFALDSFAGEVGVRFGNAIVRGTYVTSTDGGRGDGFAEIFSFDRGNGQFGPLPGDRETGYGLNAEAFIPGLNLGLFGRYGWYTNNTLGASGQTYSFGANGLDVFMPGDRLGLGYGRQLSNDGLRQASGGPVPDVWELFYDAQIVDNLRAGVTVQQRNAFTETFLGFRVRYDLSWYPLRRAAE